MGAKHAMTWNVINSIIWRSDSELFNIVHIVRMLMLPNVIWAVPFWDPFPFFVFRLIPPAEAGQTMWV